jgi:hypothetical protein
MHLAFDIGLAGLPLGVERVELEVQVMFAGLSRVDGTANGFGHIAHTAGPRRWGAFFLAFSLRPKNLGPFQLEPVMIRAIAERLG